MKSVIVNSVILLSCRIFLRVGLTPLFPIYKKDSKDALCAEVRTSKGVVMHCFMPEVLDAWLCFFVTFWMRITLEVHLGRKLITEVTISTESIQTVSDMDVSAFLTG